MSPTLFTKKFMRRNCNFHGLHIAHWVVMCSVFFAHVERDTSNKSENRPHSPCCHFFPACFTRRWKEFLDIKAYHFPSTQKTLIVFWSRTNNLLHLYAFHLIGSRGDGPFSRFLKTLYYTSLVLLICNNKRSCKGKRGGCLQGSGSLHLFRIRVCRLCF